MYFGFVIYLVHGLLQDEKVLSRMDLRTDLKTCEWGFKQHSQPSVLHFNSSFVLGPTKWPVGPVAPLGSGASWCWWAATWLNPGERQREAPSFLGLFEVILSTLLFTLYFWFASHFFYCCVRLSCLDAGETQGWAFTCRYLVVRWRTC